MLALAVYPVIVMVPRYLRVPAWGIVAIALVLWAVGTLFEMPGFTGKILANCIFFALNISASPALKRVATSGWLRTRPCCQPLVSWLRLEACYRARSITSPSWQAA